MCIANYNRYNIMHNVNVGHTVSNYGRVHDTLNLRKTGFWVTCRNIAITDRLNLRCDVCMYM